MFFAPRGVAGSDFFIVDTVLSDSTDGASTDRGRRGRASVSLRKTADAGSHPERPFLASLVPLTSRPTFFYDIRSAPLNGFFLGVMTLLPWVLKDVLGGSVWEVAVLSAAPPFSHLFDIYYAHLCTHRRKMPFVLWPGLVARFLIVLVAASVSATMLLVVASVSYVIGSMATPAVNSIWRTNYPGTHRYRVLGTVMGVMNGIAVVTSFGAGLLLRTYENDWLFRVVIVLGGAAGMIGVLIFSRIRVRGETEDLRHLGDDKPRFNPFRDLGLLWRDRKFGKYQLIQFTSGFANIMTLAVLIELMKEQHADWLSAALILGVAPNLAKTLTMPFWGRLLQRFNPMQARAFFNVFWALGYLLIAASGLAATTTGTLAWVFAGRLLLGIAQGATMLLWSLQQMYFARKQDVPKYMGVHCTLTGIRGLIAPFFGAWLMVALDSTHLVFVASAALALAAGIGSLTMARRERRVTNFTGHVDGGGLEE